MEYYDRWQDLRSFAAAAKDEEEADDFVRRQVFWQQFNAPRRRTYMPIIADDWSWQTDSMFYPLQGKLRAVFCAIEMTRRLGFVRVYKGASPTAEQCKEFLQELSETYPVYMVGADKGSEYENKTVKDWAKAGVVELIFYEKGALRSKGLVERFNLTVRRILNWYTSVRGKGWVTVLPQLIAEMYNHKKHSTIRMAPADVTDADAARIRDDLYAKGDAYREQLDRFKPGSNVRLYWRVDPDIPEEQKAFHKLEAAWSKKVYTVEKIEGYRVKLAGLPKRYSVSDLQLVSVAEGPAVPGISEVARKQKKKRAAELGEIDAVIPAREAAALQPEGRQLRPRAAKPAAAPVAPKALPKPVLNEELAPVQLGEDEAEKVLGYEFRTGRKQAGARWGLWFRVLYSSGLEKWERVNNFLVPAYEILGNKRKKQIGWNVLAPVGAYWEKNLGRDPRLNEIWHTEL